MVMRVRVRVSRVSMSVRMLGLSLIGMPMMIVMCVLMRMGQWRMGMSMAMIGHGFTLLRNESVNERRLTIRKNKIILPRLRSYLSLALFDVQAVFLIDRLSRLGCGAGSPWNRRRGSE
ncbi:MAG: hypothetical protein ABI945_00390 [Nitrospirales bacterium]